MISKIPRSEYPFFASSQQSRLDALKVHRPKLYDAFMYEISFDKEKMLVELRIGGFWDPETAQAFSTELKDVVSKASAYGPFCVLSDARDFSVQSSDVVLRFSAMAENSTANRTAIVVTSALARSQAKRSMENSRVKIFSDMDDARQWLTQSDASKTRETRHGGRFFEPAP